MQSFSMPAGRCVEDDVSHADGPYHLHLWPSRMALVPPHRHVICVDVQSEARGRGSHRWLFPTLGLYLQCDLERHNIPPVAVDPVLPV